MSSDIEVAEVNSSSDEEAVEVDSSSDEDENTDVTAASPAEDKGNPDGDDGVNTAGREKAIDMVTTPPKEKSSSESPKKSTSKETPEQQLASKKTPSSNKSSTPAGTPGSRKKSGKPTYLDMVHEAIVALKDRTGSSVPAISKWILAEYESNKSIQPNSFKNCVSNAIKQGMKEERFVKVKSSYKVNNVWVKKQKAAAKAKETEKKKREIKRKKEVEKAKLEKKKKEDDEKKKQEEVKKKAEIERKNKENELTPEQLKAKEERRKKREEAEARAKYLADRLRKRRFPMEDTKLHAEDKELGVKPPEDVTKRPTLPHTLASIVPPHLRSDSRKSSVVVNASSCGNGSWLGSGDSRGLITDALHIYHFFCGDVGFADDNHPVPKFSVKTLLHAVDEVLNGNAKAAKSLPPLLTHLFVTALRILTAPVIMDVDEKKAKDDDGMEAIQSRLQDDLSKLGEGLNPVSWSQICLFYMDLMERYYTSDASLEVGVLPGENTLDISYLWDDDKMEEDGTGAKDLNEEGHKKLPKNYNAYLGDVDGALAKGYSKLQKQNDPWNIPAEELLALLRALTDDIIANNRELSEDITGRGAKLYELQKSKNAALLKYRKVKLAFEGPKKPTKPKKPENNESVKDSDGKEGDDAGAKDESDKASVETPFVPTATKQQFLAAEKAHIKAVEAYDNGLRKLISRTEPIGFDRHLNSYYFFPHDPEMLHVEVLKNASLPPEIKKLDLTLNPNSSWRYIDTKSLFEQFLGGLDIRGIRENELFHVCSGLTVLKRKLLDENRDKSRSLARAREKEELERKLENAKSACADDGRRSGRLAGIAQDDLKKIEDEIKITTISHAAEEQQEHEALKRSFDYSVLTGLEMMTVLNANRNQNEVVPLAYVSCHRLWMDEQVDGNGTLQVLVESLSELEGKINHFSPWKREDVTREGWRTQLSDISKAWAQLCEMQLGPSQDDKAGDATSNDENSSHDDTTTPKTKKPKLDQSTPGTSEKASITYIISTVKQCLIDLELRMFEMSGIKKATEAADAVGDNREASSDDDEDGDNSKSLKCWRRKINALKRIPTQRHVLIRDIIVAAITAARKTHHNQVAADLKKALQLHRPSAAGEARVAAIEVLENYGGYDGLDEDEDVDFDELVQVDAVDQKLDEAAAAEIESMICDEVTMMSGSLGGEDNADRTDWFDVMKSCKSISRLATLTQYFLSKAEGVLSRIEEEKEILDSLLGVGSKARKSRSSKKNHDSSTPVWCDASLTDKIVKGKVSGYPWWPARICKPADTSVSNSLADLGNTLISFVGEPSVYIVTDKDVKDFVEEIEEDLSQYDQNTIENLHESTKMARKIWRTQNRGLASPWVKKSKPRFAEEKKTAH